MSVFRHSTQIPRYQLIPKTQNGTTRAADKTARATTAKAAERACYRQVDARDQYRCRVTGVKLARTGSMLVRLIHHHLIFRSQGGPHASWNVATISRTTSDEIHTTGTRRLTGDADARDATGKLNGLLNEVRLDGGAVWTVVGRV